MEADPQLPRVSPPGTTRTRRYPRRGLATHAGDHSPLTPPLDRSGEGSTPTTIYPRLGARAQLFSCPWRCERAAKGARCRYRYARGAWRHEGRGPALRGRHEGRGPALELGRGGRRAACQGQGGYGERSFQSKAGELCTVANIVHIDCQRAVEETMYTMIHALPTGCCRDDAAASGY